MYIKATAAITTMTTIRIINIIKPEPPPDSSPLPFANPEITTVVSS
jgi:hypothetical protein